MQVFLQVIQKDIQQNYVKKQSYSFPNQEHLKTINASKFFISLSEKDVLK